MLHRKPTLEGPVEYSHGEYYAKDDQSFNMNCPVQYSTGIDSRDQTTDVGNKYVVIPYGDNSGAEPCPGVTLENLEASAAADEISVGLNFTREIGLVRTAIIEMVYQYGTTTPYAGMVIAPYPGGFQEWKPGMFKLGIMLSEPGKPVNFSDDEAYRTFRVRVNIEDAPKPATEKLVVDTTNAGDHFITLSNPAKYISLALDTGAAAVAAYALTEGDYTTDATAFTQDGTDLTKVNVNDAVVGPVIITYEW